MACANDTAITSTRVILEHDTELHVFIFIKSRAPRHQVVRLWHDLSFLVGPVLPGLLNFRGVENIVALRRLNYEDSVRNDQGTISDAYVLHWFI